MISSSLVTAYARRRYQVKWRTFDYQPKSLASVASCCYRGANNGQTKCEDMSDLPWLINQSERLKALAEAGILDTAPDERFDRIVLRATQACDCPVALVSLVADYRQWFKARIGFDLCQTPIEQSVCKYALDQPGILVIPDLTADPRTADNTLVTGEPFIRFYAGARLTGRDGTAIGSLCVIDAKARPNGLTPLQEISLKSLAFECSALINSG